MESHLTGARVQTGSHQIPAPAHQRLRAAHARNPGAISYAEFHVAVRTDCERIPALAGRVPSAQDHLCMKLGCRGPDVGIESQRPIRSKQTGRVRDAGEGAHLSELLVHPQAAIHFRGHRNFDAARTVGMLISMYESYHLRIYALNAFSAHHELDYVPTLD